VTLLALLRLRPTAATALALAVLATGAPACAARPVSPAQCHATAPTRVGSLLQVAADPGESTIRGILPGPQPPAAGRPYTVRWLVDSRKASDQIRIQAAREGTSEVYRESFEVSGRVGLQNEFVAQLVFPAQGCWDADVFTGTALGSLTFKVV